MRRGGVQGGGEWLWGANRYWRIRLVVGFFRNAGDGYGVAVGFVKAGKAILEACQVAGAFIALNDMLHQHTCAGTGNAGHAGFLFASREEGWYGADGEKEEEFLFHGFSTKK